MGQNLRLKGPQNLGFMFSIDHLIIGMPKLDPKPYGNTSSNLQSMDSYYWWSNL
jgi:hypothetical protein